MNRIEVMHFLEVFFAGIKTGSYGKTEINNPSARIKPFLDIVLSLKPDLPLSIPLLRDTAALKTNKEAGLLQRRLDRRYKRLCRIQKELGSLDFKKASPGISAEDFIFSQIDFSRYRQMDEKDFEPIFPEGLADFGDDFFTKNFRSGRTEVRSMIERSYKKTGTVYRIQKENPFVLSVMRTLETSLETLPLLEPGEIKTELGELLDFAGGNGEKNRRKGELIPGAENLFPLLVYSLDTVSVSHGDGMTTTLLVSPGGDLAGTFRPAGKPWTLVLVPAETVKGAR